MGVVIKTVKNCPYHSGDTDQMYKGLQCVQTDEELSLWQLFSCAGVSNDKVVLDSHIVAKQNC